MIAAQNIAGVPNHLQVACWFFRHAVEAYQYVGGMSKLADCYYYGRGVTEDGAQAVVWFQKAADSGDAAAAVVLGSLLLNGNARAGVEKDAARGYELVRRAFAQGYSSALYHIALCYLKAGSYTRSR